MNVWQLLPGPGGYRAALVMADQLLQFYWPKMAELSGLRGSDTGNH